MFKIFFILYKYFFLVFIFKSLLKLMHFFFDYFESVDQFILFLFNSELTNEIKINKKDTTLVDQQVRNK